MRIDVSSANCRAKSHLQVRTSERNPLFRCPPLRCLPLGPPETNNGNNRSSGINDGAQRTLATTLTVGTSKFMAKHLVENSLKRACKQRFDVKTRKCSVPPFLFFLEEGKENHQKTRIFYPYRTSKIPGKEGKNAQKKQGNPREKREKKKQGIPEKNKERKDRVSSQNNPAIGKE